MRYNFEADSFQTKKIVADFLQASAFFYQNRPFCVFETPLGDLGATYDDQAHWKARSGLPISVN